MGSDFCDRPVLAIYDFRSKQEYIYRTNHMRQITGASELIAGMYAEFKAMSVQPGETTYGDARGGRIRSATNNLPLFNGLKPNLAKEHIGVEVYEGGGNLLVLYRNRAEYVNANRRFSRHVLEDAYGLRMISACAPWPEGKGDDGFEEARTLAFCELDRVKRISATEVPTNTLPFTLVDRATFQPISERVGRGDEVRELSREALCKEAAFDQKLKRDKQANPNGVPWEVQGKFIDDLGTEEGKDSLVAVLYFDGNSIGERVKNLLDATPPSEYVSTMRSFSKKLHESLVGNTVRGIDAAIGLTPKDADAGVGEQSDGENEADTGRLSVRHKGYRVIIDHGDEITVVCNAHAAPFAIDAYFAAIEESEYKACCGMAFCHSHDPFSEVYKIAEECCESGKKANRRKQREAMEGLAGQEARAAAAATNASYVDFHFCRSGITGTLDQIREAQEEVFVARPYEVGDTYDQFLHVGERLARSKKIQRSDIKELGRAILKGDSWYRLEYERLKAKDLATFANDGIEGIVTDGALRKRILFDVCSMWDVFDVRFAKGLDQMGEVKHGA